MNELYHYNHNHDPRTGKFTFSKGGGYRKQVRTARRNGEFIPPKKTKELNIRINNQIDSKKMNKAVEYTDKWQTISKRQAEAENKLADMAQKEAEHIMRNTKGYTYDQYMLEFGRERALDLAYEKIRKDPKNKQLIDDFDENYVHEKELEAYIDKADGVIKSMSDEVLDGYNKNQKIKTKYGKITAEQYVKRVLNEELDNEMKYRGKGVYTR